MKKNSLIYLLCIILPSIFPSSPTIAQEGGKFDLGADIFSRYVWRGTDFGNSPAIQPAMSYSNSGFKVGTWGSYTISSNSLQEVDLYVSYDVKEVVTFTITDYFLLNGTSANNKYFDYSKDSTHHQFEGTAAFKGVKNFPIAIAVNYNFYGYDKRNAWYFELGYGNTFKKTDYNIFLGGGTGAYYLYGKNNNDFGIVNVGFGLAKDIKITEKYALPVKGSLIFNPTAQSVFVVFGISF
jgi:hypothetical protein